MKVIISSNNISYCKHRTKVLTKLLIYTIFITILIKIKCEEEKAIIDKNDLFLFLTKDGYLHAFEKKETEKEINEKWKLFFGTNLITKDINSHKVDEGIYLFSIIDKLYIFTLNNNKLIPFDIFVKELTNNINDTNNNSFIEGKINNSFFIIDLKNGDILEKKICEHDKCNLEKKIEKNSIFLKKVDYFLLNKNKTKNDNFMNISYSDIIIEGKNNKIGLLDENNNMNILYDLFNYYKFNLKIDKIMTIYYYNYDKKIFSLLYNKNPLCFNINTNKLNNKKEILNSERNNNKECNDIINKLNNNNSWRNTIFNYFILIVIAILFIKYIPKIFIINFNNTNIFNEN